MVPPQLLFPILLGLLPSNAKLNLVIGIESRGVVPSAQLPSSASTAPLYYFFFWEKGEDAFSITLMVCRRVWVYSTHPLLGSTVLPGSMVAPQLGPMECHIVEG